eukprot:gene11781-15763_t
MLNDSQEWDANLSPIKPNNIDNLMDMINNRNSSVIQTTDVKQFILEDESSIPEAMRLYGFIRNIEDDLNFTANMMSNDALGISAFDINDADSDDGLTNEYQNLPLESITGPYFVDGKAKYTTYTPIKREGISTTVEVWTDEIIVDEDLNVSVRKAKRDEKASSTQLIATPMTITEIIHLETPFSKVDEMFEALVKSVVWSSPTRQRSLSGSSHYSNSSHINSRFSRRVHLDLPYDQTLGEILAMEPLDPSPVKKDTDKSINTFFGSAFASPFERADSTEKEEITFSTDRPPSPLLLLDMYATGGSPKSGGRNFDFTRESLRRNWDMEEDDDDDYEEDENKAQDISMNVVEEFADLVSVTLPKDDEQAPPPLLNEPIESQSSDTNNEFVIAVSTENKDYTMIQPNIPMETSSKDINKLMKPKVDPRIHGDFTVWSEGSKLTYLGIKTGYVGLHNTSLTHNFEKGALVYGVAPVSQSGNNNNNNNTSNNNNINPTEFGEGPQDGGGYYCMHVLECVVRPDIELKTLMGIVFKVAKANKNKCVFYQRNHAVVYANSNRSITQVMAASVTNVVLSAASSSANVNNTNNTHSTNVISHRNTAAEIKEWDIIDIQVAVSRELRQRVLLCQFLRKINPFKGVGIGGMILSHLTPTMYPLSQCPKSKRFMSNLKKELTATESCLSSLYTVSLTKVCCLPQGLDTQFRAQFQSLCRDIMWKRLDQDFKVMQDHLEYEESECLAFAKTLESIFKQYGIKMPPGWVRQELSEIPLQISPSAHNSNTSTPQRIIESMHKLGGNNVTFSTPPTNYNYNSSSSNNSNHNNHNTNSNNNTPNVSTFLSKESYSSPVKPVLSSTTSRPASINISNRPSSINLPHIVNNMTSESTDSIEPVNLNNLAIWSSAYTPPSPNKVNSSQSTDGGNNSRPNSTKLSPTGNNSSNNNKSESKYGKNTFDISSLKKVDGMTFCLVMLDQCFEDLQKRCDAEYSARIQQKNEMVVSTIQRMNEYRRSLLTFIAYNPKAESSSIMKTFKASFNKCKITRFSKMDKESNKKNLTHDSYSLDSCDLNDVSEELANAFYEQPYHPNDERTQRSQGSPESFDVKKQLPRKPSFLGTATNNKTNNNNSNNNEERKSENGSGWGSMLWSSSSFLFSNNNTNQTNDSKSNIYNNINTNNNNNNNNNKKSNENGNDGLEFGDVILHNEFESIVLYYCACMMSNIPGTVYLTPRYIALISSILVGLVVTPYKEIFLLSELLEVIPLSHEVTQTPSKTIYQSNTLKLVFGGINNEKGTKIIIKKKEIFIAPLAVDCLRLRLLLLDVKEQFVDNADANS